MRLERAEGAVAQPREQVLREVGTHPDVEPAVGAHRAVCVQLGGSADQPDAGVVHARHAGRQVRLIGGGDRVRELGGGRRGHRGIGGERRGLGQHPGRLAARVPLDDAADRVGAVPVDADRPQAGGVEHAEVPGDVHQADRVVGRDRVQVGSGGVPVVGQQGVVVAEPADPPARLRVGDRLRQPVDDVGDPVVGRRTGLDRRVEGQPPERRVGVRLDEPRHGGAPAQVEHPGVLVGEPGHLAVGAHREHPPVAQRERGRGAPDGVEGADRAADQDGVGARCRRVSRHGFPPPPPASPSGSRG